MNNCVKCGNPLQPGVTSCPICGTVAQPTNETLDENIGVEVQQPAQSVNLQPLTPPAVQQPVQMPSLAPAPSALPQEQILSQPSLSQPIVENGANMSQPSSMVNMGGSQPAQPVDFSASQPTQTFQSNPINSVGVLNSGNSGSTINQNSQQVNTLQQPSLSGNPKGDKKNILLLAVVAVVAIGIGIVSGYFINPMLNEPVVIPQVEASDLDARSNGFSFNIEKDWLYNQYGDKVIISNADETLTMRISRSSGVFSDINLKNIENSLKEKEGYSDIKIDKITIEDVDVVLVDCKNEELLIQYYYLKSDESSVITSVVIYETEEAKTKDEDKVKKIIQTLTYTDEALKAIGAVNMYSSKFDDATYVFFDAITPKTDNTVEENSNLNSSDNQ